MADSEDPQPAVPEGDAQQQEEESPSGETQEATTENGATTEGAPQAEEQGETTAETEQQRQEGEGPAEDVSQAEVTEATEAVAEEAAEEAQGEQTQEEAAADATEQQQQRQQEDEQTTEEQQAEPEQTQEAVADSEATEETSGEAPQPEQQNEQSTEEAVDEVHENGVVDEQEGESVKETQEAASSEMSDAEKEKCRAMFDKKAKDGRLDLKGFKVLFRLMGEVLSTEDADSMFQDGNRDDQNTIDFDEFCRLYCKFSEAEQERKEAVASSIEKLFPTSDGQPVSLRKVENLLMKLQKPDLSMRLVREKSDLGQDDVRRLVKAMDKDGNGVISKNEFVETLCGHLQM